MVEKIKLKDIEETVKAMETEAALTYLYALKEEHALSLEKLIKKYTKKKETLEKEKDRFNDMCKYEIDAYKNGCRLIAGIDEAGRGPLAGPVVAAAVILPENIFIPNLNDSKKLSPKQRDILFDEIREKAISYGVGIVDHTCIDKINILNATKQAMYTAVKELKPQPDFLLIDAVKLENISISQKAYEKGDANSISIAAASIIAKVTRDRMIEELDALYPNYGLAKHKGYGTAEHIEAIKKYGPCPIHRLTFIKNFTT